jgi:dTDP-4-dehydrorhamnose reductase
MRAVIIGANGQLGAELAEVLSDWDVVGLTHGELDIRDPARVREALSRVKPDTVINTAAFNRVDDCEDDPDNAFSVNAHGARNLARVSADLHCTLMHISTDYVFGGEKTAPYTEDDLPNPLSVYGGSKLAGEYFVRNICPAHFVVRTSGLYGVAGSRGKGGNFVETMIRMAGEGRRLRVVDDQVLTPTYTRDLAEKLKAVAQTQAYGLYHITNRGQCSWYEFAARIFFLLGLKPDFSPTTTKAFGAKARRPAYSVLAPVKLKQLGVGDLPAWDDALERYLSEKGYLRKQVPNTDADQ